MPSQTALCPSCGAPVEFRAGASVLLVCPYCHSTLLRSAEKIENLGKMAELIEDFSPLQIGSEGHYRGRHFTLIGRTQMRYASGVWNEWYLLFDDQKDGWLSDANGDYTLSFAESAAENLPPFSQLRPGDSVNLAGQAFSISNLEEATCVAGEGELPFEVGAGFPAPVVDARFGSLFATLDYSETPPLVFIGESVERDSLKLTNLRQNVPVSGKMEQGLSALDCPSCGGPISLSNNAIQRVACPSCGSLLDADDRRLILVEKAHAALNIEPALALGSKGRLSNVEYEIIGFMRRKTKIDGISYSWDEYLLFDPRGEFRWLTCSEGHWSFIRVLKNPPILRREEAAFQNTTPMTITYEGEVYRHFQHCSAVVSYVLGQFNWRVCIGESANLQDYVAPPKMLSREATDKEIIWSVGDYLPAETITAAFKPKKPLAKPQGVYANQPNPLQERYRNTLRTFLKMAAGGLVLQILLMLFSLGGTLDDEVFVYGGSTKSHESKPFQFSGGNKALRISNQATFENAWLELDMTLLNETTGESWNVPREISYYAGVDGGESWSEGSKTDEIVFTDLPAGTYRLSLEGEVAPELNGMATARMNIRRGGAQWGNFFLLLIFLAAFPLWAYLRQRSFETKRWMESDHPPKTSSDDDDDD